jgi:site-specific recombinase XerD
MLLERAFSAMHDGNSSRNYVNPAALARGEQGAAWKKVSGNLPTSFLTFQERDILIKYLESGMKEMSPTKRWRELRNRALVATFLGAGLKVSEATALTVGCMAQTDPDGWLEIAVFESKYSRRVLPAPFAVRLLRDWTAERTAKSELTRGSGNQSELLFPAQKCGGRMTSIPPFRITAAIVRASGLSDAREERLSPQTMRNSFIAECFESGHTTREVALALGFATILTAERLKQAWAQWKER